MPVRTVTTPTRSYRRWCHACQGECCCPGSGSAGATGATGPAGPAGPTYLKFSGILPSGFTGFTVPADDVFILGFLSDRGSAIDALANSITPNYPSIETISFDALATDLKSGSVTVPSSVPAGTEIAVQLVANSIAATGLEVVYPAGTVAPVSVQDPGLRLQALAGTPVPFTFPQTYDIRIILRNLTGVDIVVSDAVPYFVSVTLRSIP